MSARGALALALLVVVALVAFAAFLLNVPIAGVLAGSLVASVGIVWVTLRRRKEKKPEASGGPDDSAGSSGQATGHTGAA